MRARLLLLCGMLWTSPAHSGDLVGRVFQGMAPLNNVNVLIAGPKLMKTVTNPSGFHVVHDLPEGEYTVTILERSQKVYVFKTGESRKDFHF